MSQMSQSSLGSAGIFFHYLEMLLNVSRIIQVDDISFFLVSDAPEELLSIRFHLFSGSSHFRPLASSVCIMTFLSFLCFFFLQLHLWHIEVSRLQLNWSCICDLCPSLQQCWILNPLSKARDWIHILTEAMLGSSPAEPHWKLQHCDFSVMKPHRVKCRPEAPHPQFYCLVIGFMMKFLSLDTEKDSGWFDSLLSSCSPWRIEGDFDNNE